MRLTLIHNPTAGSGRPSGDALRVALRAAGWEVAYHDTESDDVVRALGRPADVVLVAGGDGAVGDVARCVVARRGERRGEREAGHDVPLAILPLGTANNIAHSLGVMGATREVLAGLHPDRLARLARRRLGVATARAPWGTARFVESAGVGLVTALLRDAAEHAGEGESDGTANGTASGTDEVAVGRRRLRRVLARAPARRWHVEADGLDVSGAYSMVEAASTRWIGPHVALAPVGAGGDGWLHLALLRPEDHAALDAYLARDHAAEEPEAPPVRTRRVRRVRLSWDAHAGHLDDEPWPGDDAEDEPKGAEGDGRAVVELAVTDAPIEVLVPDGV